MERSRKVSAVIFDLGEVLATPGDGLYEQLATATNAPLEAVKHAYWAERDGYDRGSALEDYWGNFARTLGHVDADADLLRRLSDIDSTAWVSIREDARDVLRELDAHEVPTAILSNAPVALGVLARESNWAQWVTRWFFSGDLGLAKPDLEIYEVVSLGLGVPPAEVVFFDDRIVNVEAAQLVGWNAFLWESGETTRATLVDLGIL
ncbi:MAG: hypothetical protein K0S37_2853 [Microbacterium sp.]|jgi:putative hydrolase of the HAD superfamily|nr:hypothetical protein [Microbacterium sp.]